MFIIDFMFENQYFIICLSLLVICNNCINLGVMCKDMRTRFNRKSRYKYGKIFSFN